MNRCPECRTAYPDDFVRCPYCHAYTLDATPWKTERHLFALIAAVLLWLCLYLLTLKVEIPFENVIKDGISQTIVFVGFYSFFLILLKMGVVGRQIIAYRLIRSLCSDDPPLKPELLERVREKLKQNGIIAYNTTIGYQRLAWLVAVLEAEEQVQSRLLEAFKQHGENDWDALDNAFATIQFIIWLLPTVGFLGTVYGMTTALQSFSTVVAKGSDLGFSAGLTETAQGLGVAFHTTLVGLVAVIPILALTTLVRQRAQSLLEQQNKFFLRLIAREFSAITPVAENTDNDTGTPLQNPINSPSNSTPHPELGSESENNYENDNDAAADADRDELTDAVTHDQHESNPDGPDRLARDPHNREV